MDDIWTAFFLKIKVYVYSWGYIHQDMLVLNSDSQPAWKTLECCFFVKELHECSHLRKCRECGSCAYNYVSPLRNLIYLLTVNVNDRYNNERHFQRSGNGRVHWQKQLNYTHTFRVAIGVVVSDFRWITLIAGLTTVLSLNCGSVCL